MFHRSRKILGQKPHTDPGSKPSPAALVQVTIDYHDRTKHHPGRSAAALGFMDWDTQPDPFRTFEGAPRVQLALRDPTEGPTYQAALLECQVEPAPLTHTMISQLFQDGLASPSGRSLTRPAGPSASTPSAATSIRPRVTPSVVLSRASTTRLHRDPPGVLGSNAAWAQTGPLLSAPLATPRTPAGLRPPGAGTRTRPRLLRSRPCGIRQISTTIWPRRRHGFARPRAR